MPNITFSLRSKTVLRCFLSCSFALFIFIGMFVLLVPDLSNQCNNHSCNLNISKHCFFNNLRVLCSSGEKKSVKTYFLLPVGGVSAETFVSAAFTIFALWWKRKTFSLCEVPRHNVIGWQPANHKGLRHKGGIAPPSGGCWIVSAAAETLHASCYSQKRRIQQK